MKCIDIIILCLWIAYCGIYVSVLPLRENLRLILFPVVFVLFIDFVLVDFLGIYRPLRDHLKAYSLRGFLAAMPIILFLLFE